MLIRLKLILVIYKCILYVNYSRFIVGHFMALRCGRLTLYFKNVCICWNKAVRRIVDAPYTTHTWMLGPILNQTHISSQLIKRCIRFLFGMASSPNIIVYTCYKNVVGNANTPTLGSNIAYFRDKYGIEVNRLSKNITELDSEPKLSIIIIIIYNICKAHYSQINVL